MKKTMVTTFEYDGEGRVVKTTVVEEDDLQPSVPAFPSLPSIPDPNRYPMPPNWWQSPYVSWIQNVGSSAAGEATTHVVYPNP